MKTIKNPVSAERPIPAIFEGIRFGDEPEVVTNPIMGGSCELPPDAVAMYDCIIGAEYTQQWEHVRAGLAWFREYFPKEYMVLLD